MSEKHFIAEPTGAHLISEFQALHSRLAYCGLREVANRVIEHADRFHEYVEQLIREEVPSLRSPSIPWDRLFMMPLPRRVYELGLQEIGKVCDDAYIPYELHRWYTRTDLEN